MTNIRRWSSALAIGVLLAACSSSSKSASTTTTTQSPKATNMKLESIAFAPNGPMPTEETCAGENKTPPLEWSGVPAGAKSLALVVHDPDAPLPGGFTHWILVDIPPTDGKLPPLPAGARGLPNGAGRTEWMGPCPPAGKPHHYVFTLYALNGEVQAGANPAATIENIKQAATDQAEYVGTYSR